ncbi:MAG: tetratricopeptide repeat protein, partial [Pleurocapsa sp.]
MIGETIGEKYQIVKYLGGKQEINSYVANSLSAKDKSRYYIEILHPKVVKSSLSETTNQIMIGLNNLSIIDKYQRLPNPVEYFVDRSKIYIVQEYIEGKNLARIIEDQFILSEAEVIEILMDAAIALQPIHKQQVIHGNIQPSSLIKRQKDQKISLVDFNLVKEAINIIPNSKAGYIPPEQIAGRVTYNSDIYALGMTAIHVLTGTSPHKLEKNPRTGEILWHRKARISPNFARILDKMIYLDKNLRYQSLQKVVKDLKKIKHKSKFRGIYKYILLLPVLAFAVAIGYAQWAQRVAILEFYQGDQFFREKQYQQAINYYNNGLKKLPNTKGQVRNFEPVWLKKAKAQRQLNKYEEALATCSLALKHYQSPQLWNCKALTLYSLERYDSAITAYDEAIKIAPKDVWLWNNRGEAYTRLQQTDKAVFDFQRAIDLAPSKSFVPWNNLGKLHYQQREYEQAIKAYEQALTVKPDYLPALIGVGNVQTARRFYDDAAESYNQALAINPDYH